MVFPRFGPATFTITMSNQTQMLQGQCCNRVRPGSWTVQWVFGVLSILCCLSTAHAGRCVFDDDGQTSRVKLYERVAAADHILFKHRHKTGGTEFVHSVLSKLPTAVPNLTVNALYNDPNNQPSDPTHQKVMKNWYVGQPLPRIIAGHNVDDTFHEKYIPADATYVYVTFIRDPLQTFLSWYFHVGWQKQTLSGAVEYLRQNPPVKEAQNPCEVSLMTECYDASVNLFLALFKFDNFTYAPNRKNSFEVRSRRESPALEDYCIRYAVLKDLHTTLQPVVNGYVAGRYDFMQVLGVLNINAVCDSS